jgi:hypothetical protein
MVNLWTSLAGKLGLYGEIQNNVDSVSKEDGELVFERQQLVFFMTAPTFIYTRTHVNMTCIYTGTHVNTHKHTHTHTHTHTHERERERERNTCIYICLTHKHAHTHTSILTHT